MCISLIRSEGHHGQRTSHIETSRIALIRVFQKSFLPNLNIKFSDYEQYKKKFKMKNTEQEQCKHGRLQKLEVGSGSIED